jgi:hypothetical protein
MGFIGLLGLIGLNPESGKEILHNPVFPSVVPQDSRLLNTRSKSGGCLAKVNQLNAIRDPAVFKLFPNFAQNPIRQIAYR